MNTLLIIAVVAVSVIGLLLRYGNWIRADFHDARARHFTRQGNVAEKQKHYRRAAELWEIAGERGLAARALANWHNNNGDYLVAAEKYGEALANAPGFAGSKHRSLLLMQRMLSLWQAGRYEAANVAARAVASENAAEGSGAIGYRMLALAFGRVGQFVEAERFIEEAAKREQTPIEAGRTLAVRYLFKTYQGRFAEIIKRCESDEAGTEASAQVLQNYAGALSAVARFDEAAEVYRAGIIQAPTSDKMTATTTVALLQIGLALVELERGNHAEARALLETAAPLLESLPLMGYYLPAVRVLSDALSGNDASDALRARILAERGRVREAMETYPDPADGKRHYNEILIHLSRALLAVGEPEQALQTLEPLATDNALLPGSLPTWHFWRGRVLEASGNTNAARREYNRVIEIGEPENRYVKDARTWLAAFAGNAPDA
ncbi:MAG: tetratricopeptide repeat protein [Armatimonadetes bacterium]|nr:tetratricopeptide repeat protein [Armatimonadota bacterium]